ncbi:MAG: hypothetical protein ACYDGO_14140 [Smithellaceae bacterium]
MAGSQALGIVPPAGTSLLKLQITIAAIQVTGGEMGEIQHLHQVRGRGPDALLQQAAALTRFQPA